MNTHEAILEQIDERAVELGGGFLTPPPVFMAMGAEFLSFDAEAGTIQVRFPVEMKYSRPVTPEMGYIVVEARLLDRKERQLFFNAVVRHEAGQLLARAKAIHWIVGV